MKKSIYLFLVLLSFSILTISCVEKNPAIKKKVALEESPVESLNRDFYKVKFLDNNDNILVSSQNDKGLKIYSFSEDKLQSLNSKEGAGLNPMVTPDGKKIVYQTTEFKNRRRSTGIYVQDINTFETIPVIENKRGIKLLEVENDYVYYLDGDKVMSYEIKTGKTTENPKNIVLAFTDNDVNLVVYKNGIKKELNPKGKGNYIWVSISPDKKHILFNKAGDGTYISDFSGKNIVSLGRLHAPKWSRNGKYIVGMDDYDDGQKFTKSDIIRYNIETKERENLTKNSDVIALYPDINNSGDKIVFNDENGKVFMMNLKTVHKK